MRKSAFFVSFMSLGMVLMMLFQNCGQLESQKVPELSFSQEGNTNNNDNVVVPLPEPQPPLPPAPDLGPRFALDNLMPAGELNFDLSLGDVLHYETNYRSSMRLTLVTMRFVNGANIITVSSDTCTNQAALAFEEYDAVFTIIANAGNSAMPRALINGEMVQAGCAFPRLGLDGIGDKIDYELYTAPRECVPEGALYNAQHAQEMNAWFQSKIDDLCPM